jgi:molybdenum cofactor cytidylyltransferase
MISAIILAAGESRRMGQPKMLLSWGNSTMLGHVISVLKDALKPEALLVVTGAAREDVEAVVEAEGVRSAFNPRHQHGGMLSSIQVGLSSLNPRAQAALVCLGDQPQVDAQLVLDVVEAYQRTGAQLIVPSYQMRRGHPWLLDRSLWSELLTASATSARAFLNRHASEIYYVRVQAPSALQDVDTPEDYVLSRPGSGKSQ